MRLSLHKAPYALLTAAFLTMPFLASAHYAQEVAIRTDGTLQSVYSLRGHFQIINRISRRNMRKHTLVERINPVEWLPKEII